MLRKTAGFVVARLVPGLASFAALMVFTRILSPAQYGTWVLVMSAVMLAKAVLFSWLEAATLRIASGALDAPAGPAATHARLLATVLMLFTGIALAVAVPVLLLAWAWPDPVVGGLIAIAVLVFVAHGWFELNLALAQARHSALRYGAMMATRALCLIGVGGALALAGAGAQGPLAGFLAGSAVAGVAVAFRDWRAVRPRIDRLLATELFQYGAPLTGTIALAFFLDVGDRFLIAAFLGQAAVGAYAAAYDLAQQSLAVLMISVNLAAYPLAIAAFERGGAAGAASQIRQNGALLLAIGLPATAGLVLLNAEIVTTIIGAPLREAASSILPLVACAILISCLRTCYFDLAFLLTRRTRLLLWAPAVALLVNVVLNVLWLPRFGIVGAAWATLVAYGVATLVCVLLGRRLLVISPDWSQVARIGAATVAMVLVLQQLPAWDGAAGLAAKVLTGAVVYGLGMLIGNVLNTRTLLFTRFGWRTA